jgi:hypothetical protein
VTADSSRERTPGRRTPDEASERGRCPLLIAADIGPGVWALVRVVFLIWLTTGSAEFVVD